MGKMKWRDEAIIWIDQTRNIKPLRKKFRWLKLFRVAVQVLQFIRIMNFILYFVSVDTYLVYEFE